MTEHPPDRIAAFVVDDYPLVRLGLALLLEQGGVSVCGEADSIRATLDHPGLASAQVVLLDILLDQASGVDLIPTLRRLGLHVVICSMHEDPGVVRRALAAGAAGYVTKREVAQSLVEAVRTVVAGGNYISPRVAAALAQHRTDPDPCLHEKPSA